MVAPCLHWSSSEGSGSCYASRLVDADPSEKQHHVTRLTKIEAAVMSDVADWWHSHYMDEFWTPKNKQQQLVHTPPTANQILSQIKCSRVLARTTHMSGNAFELLVHSIALQLLASCYTFLPTTSAYHIPILQQRTRPRPITALRLHTQHRFEPAAGHHARVSSETAVWPGLYAGPALEDTAVEVVTKRRRQKRNSNCVPYFAANSWTDGSAPPDARHMGGDTRPTAYSSSSSETGFFSKLICQPSIPKNPRRKHNTLFTSLATRRGRSVGALRSEPSSSKPRRKRLKIPQSFTGHTVQRIPSVLRLRKTQSTPRMEGDEPDSISNFLHVQRHSSNPSVGSPLEYPFEIPEVRRISATPAGTPYDFSSSHSVRLCGRGDLITASECLQYSQSDESLPSIMTSKYSKNNNHDVLSLPTVDSETLSPFATSSRTTRTARSNLPKDYFASVHAATHVHDDKDFDVDLEDRFREEREIAGPSLEESPFLQQIFAKIDADEETYMSDDDSSDSTFRKDRKRGNILDGPETTSSEIMARFGCRRQNTIPAND